MTCMAAGSYELLCSVDDIPNITVAMEMLMNHLDPTLGDHMIQEDDGWLFV